MPYFTLHRDYVLRTTKGHAIGFIKGERTWVPPACVPDVVAIGAQAADGAVDVLGEEKGPVVELTHEERSAKLHEAFRTLLGRNQRGDFGANGLPAQRRLEELVGFDVPNKERDAAWLEFSKVAE
jgi:hypothetical protein